MRLPWRGRLWTPIALRNGVYGDRVYALACDRLGRVWIGTQNGVSVLVTGELSRDKITTYRTIDGLNGERIFSIAISPQDGDVWIATNAGITHYSLKTDSWRTYSRADGLPAVDVCALCFAPDGTLYAGTQTNGLAIASLKDDYATWRAVDFERALPLVPEAKNRKTLPSGQINAIRVLDDGTVCVATPTGLAISRDRAQSWTWLRGANWADKVRGLLGGAPKDWKETPGAALADDYVSSLAQGANGELVVGTRQKGLEVLNAKLEAKQLKSNADFVRTLFTLPDGSLLVGVYGGGLQQIAAPPNIQVSSAPNAKALNLKVASASASPTPPTIPSFPKAAAAPTLAELNALLKSLGEVPSLSDDAQPSVVALPDDWLTQGTQLGRYGRYWFCGLAMYEPTQGPNYIWGAGEHLLNYTTRTGLNSNDDDSLRYYITSLYSQEVRSLEMPSIFMDSRVLKGYATWPNNRRQSEADDHGETYANARNGPSVYVNLEIPAGVWTLSLYDFNKDGWAGDNRFRDYKISIRPHRDELNITQITNFEKQPELARGTIRDFVGGVWKRFQVRGPQQLTVEIGRNYSFNTILAGVTLDKTDEEAAPYFHTWDEDRVLETKRAALRQKLDSQTPTERARRFVAGTDVEEVAERLFTQLQHTRSTNATYWAQENRRYLVPLARYYRDKFAALQSATSEKQELILTRLGSCLYDLNAFDDWEAMQRHRGLLPSRDIELGMRWNGVNDDHRTQGRRFINDYLQMRKDLGLLALDPKNVQAEQTRRREAFLAQQIEDLRFEPPTSDMMDGPFMKPGAKLKERSPEEYKRIVERARKYQPLD